VATTLGRPDRPVSPPSFGGAFFRHDRRADAVPRARWRLHCCAGGMVGASNTVTAYRLSRSVGHLALTQRGPWIRFGERTSRRSLAPAAGASCKIEQPDEHFFRVPRCGRRLRADTEFEGRNSCRRLLFRPPLPLLAGLALSTSFTRSTIRRRSAGDRRINALAAAVLPHSRRNRRYRLRTAHCAVGKVHHLLPQKRTARRLRDIRRMLKPTRPHSVHTLLVFLQLLEC
jgi:hypothetical protein